MKEEDFEAAAVSEEALEEFPEHLLEEYYREEEEREKEAARPETKAAEGLVGNTILDKLTAFIGRFVFLKEKSIYLLLALWIVETYMYEDFDFIGYLFVHSAEPQSGKTRVFELLELLANKPIPFSASASQASLFRVTGCTQLIDEVDSLTNREELQGVLNAGFKKRGRIYRVEKTKDGRYEPVPFNVYCPRALAGIGTKIIAASTRDRTFMIRMERRTKKERGEQFKARRVAKEAESLVLSIQEWLKTNRQRIREVYDKEDPGYLDNFSERTIDVASPLAAILEVMFDGSDRLPELRRTLALAVAKTRSEVQQVEDLPILEGLLKLSQVSDPLVGNATELAAQLGLGEQGDHYKIAAVLQRHGFSTKSMRKDGENPIRRYEMPLSDIRDIVERYGGVKMADDAPADKSANIKGDVVSVVTKEQPTGE